jgi:hypothetical protein
LTDAGAFSRTWHGRYESQLYLKTTIKMLLKRTRTYYINIVDIAEKRQIVHHP